MVFRGSGVIKFLDLAKTWDDPMGQPAAPIENFARFLLPAIIDSWMLACWLSGCPGNLIASTVTKPNKHIVAFFEKNGLQHGEFKLRFKIYSV